VLGDLAGAPAQLGVGADLDGRLVEKRLCGLSFCCFE
jgi:hypothetical protein